MIVLFLVIKSKSIIIIYIECCLSAVKSNNGLTAFLFIKLKVVHYHVKFNPYMQNDFKEGEKIC